MNKRKIKMISVRVDENLAAEIERFAVAENRTISNAVTVLLKAGLEATLPKTPNRRVYE